MTQIILVLAALINAVILGFVSRRLLGVPVGWPRTILVSLIVTWVFDQLVQLIARIPGVSLDISTTDTDITAQFNTPETLLIVLLGLAWAVAFGLALLVILEAIVPTGSLPRLVPWLRGIPARWRRSRRYVQIVAIATRHGLGGYLRGRGAVPSGESHSSIARSLRDALAEGGVTFVKLGQMLAARPDVVGPTFAQELSHLQANVPAEPWSRVEPVVETELGRPLSEVFANVDPEPLAAASVAQVYSATLLDGTPVVVKVQRPEARSQVTADVDIVLRLARWLNRTTTWAPRLGVLGLAQGFAESLEEELDYRVEMRNHAAIEASLDPQDGILVPHVYPELSSSRLIVMQRMPGTPLSRAGALLAEMSVDTRNMLARGLLRSMLRQVMVAGVFHADLHQGNVLVELPGRLALLDLGFVGRLDSGSREALGLLLHSVQRRDSLAATDALLALLDRPEVLDDRAFERDVGQLLQRFTGPTLGVSGATSGLFSALFSLVVRYHFAVPSQVASALRALAALEGTLRSISPQVDLVSAAKEEGQALIAADMGPEQVRKNLEDQLITMLPLLQRLPRRINAIAENLEYGRTIITVRALADEQDRSFLIGIVQQLMTTILATACAICGVLLVTSETGPLMLPTLRLYTFLGGTLLLFGFVLAARALVRVFRPYPIQRARPDS